MGCDINTEQNINPEKPEDTVVLLQEILSNEEIPEREHMDMFDGIREGYTLDEQNFLFLTKTGDEIEQINLLDITKEEAEEVLSLIGFPEVSTFVTMLNYSEEEREDSANIKSHFTSYEGVGVKLEVNEDMLTPGGAVLFEYDEPYSLSIVYNEDRFDDFK